MHTIARQPQAVSSLDATRARLKTWGWWQAQLSSPIGGAVTMDYRGRDWIDGPRDHGQSVALDHPEAERMDRILAKVRVWRPELFLILWRYYDPRQELSLAQLAIVLRISEKTAKDRKRRGEDVVDALWHEGIGEIREKSAGQGTLKMVKTC